jgi:DNA-binding CsgD family transcriptional regulator
MAQQKLTTWLEYIDAVSSEISLTNEEKSNFSDQIISLNKGFLSVFFHSVPMVYLLDYTTGKYLTMSKSAEAILGFNAKDFIEGGLGFTIELYQRDHLKLFDSQIFPDRLKVLKTIPPEQHGDYLFSYNLSIKNHKGEYMNFLQRNTFIKSDQKGNPLLSLGLVINIEHYGKQSPTIQVVEKINTDSLHQLPEVVFKKSYYFNEIDQIISKREREILLWMAEGLTSKEIAAKLFISEGTVIIHRKHMLQKTGSLNVAALVAFALKNQII